MKALFLDIDGVLNSHHFYHVTRGGEHFRTLDEQLDPETVTLLNEIVDRTGCVVVLSSTWRLYHGLANVQFALCTFGFEHRLFGATPHSSHGYRGKEILAWLSENPEVTTFAVVDDSSDMDGVRERFVQTSWQRGLEREHVEKLVALLGEKVEAVA